MTLGLMHRLVLLRHGESTWNKENRFTGWSDVGLTKLGVQQVKAAAKRLRLGGYRFDIAYTSKLRRARQTLKIALSTMEHSRIPIRQDWRLNERHYGALQGLNKSETARKYGENQVKIWRRAYATRPPLLSSNDKRYLREKKQFGEVMNPPRGESLKDVVKRVLPWWMDATRQIRNGSTMLVSAHGNSIRALVKHIDRLSDKQIMKTNIPVGIPLVYELDRKLRPIRHYYLASKTEINRAFDAIKKQGKREAK
jgi:2,3-bisphosphoglycerate-dependent phosphoglycerate mutase